MANKYLSSSAAGGGTGADWTNAYTTIAAAAAGMAAGDDLWVADNHNETSASAITANFPATLTNPNRIICVNHLGTVPPVAADVTTGAQITTTGTSALTIATTSGTGGLYVYGLKLTSGSGASTQASILLNSSSYLYENCTFVVATTAGLSRLQFETASSVGRFKNCSATFSNASQGINQGSGHVQWVGGSIAATGTVPTVLTPAAAGAFGYNIFDGADLSAFGSGKSLWTAGPGLVTFTNCKLGASVAAISGSITEIPRTSGVDIFGSDSTGNVERNERYRSQGTLTTETTVIRIAGATDGTTAYSWKIASSSLAVVAWPFETFEGAMWCSTLGSSRTLTFHCLTDNVALNNNDIWAEVKYLGTAGNPQATLISSGPANILSSGSALTSDSAEPWTTTGIVTPNKQKFSVTFTPQIAGPIRWKVKVAKVSTTVYVCPEAVLS